MKTTNRLPKIYDPSTNQWYVVDFTLEEMRPLSRPFDTIEFTDILDKEIKSKLRALRALTDQPRYMKGLDD